MSGKKIYTEFKGNLEDMLSSDQEIIYLVGAGVSIDPPSNLLPANLFTRYLLDFVSVKEEIEPLMAIDTLRYEMIAEILQRYFDYSLEFMDYFALFKSPNLIHYFLANSILNGKIVCTTNFDYLIEYALLKILPKQLHNYITPIITPDDFKRYKDPKSLNSEGKYLIYKLHGAKRNIITNINTRESLVTTLSAFGKGSNVLSLDQNKSELLQKSIQDCTLIVMGYSGSDDFDILPMLRSLTDLKRLIWIDHASEKNAHIFEYDPKASFVIPRGLSRTEETLAEISSNTESQVILIKTNTGWFIKEKLWGSLLKNKPFPQIEDDETPQSIQSLDIWLKEKFENIPEVLKWKSTCDLYYELGYNAEFLRCADNGLKIARMVESSKMISEFLNLKGIYFYRQKDYEKALEFYLEALKLTEKKGLEIYRGARLNNIGLVYLDKGDYNKAMEYFETALKLGKMRGDHEGIASRLSNIGLSYLFQGKYENAKAYFSEALKIDEKTGNLIGRSIRLKNMGDLLKAQQNIMSALEYYRQSYQIIQKLGNLNKLGEILTVISKTQKEKGDFSRALLNIKNAIRYLTRAKNISTLNEAEHLQSLIEKELH